MRALSFIVAIILVIVIIVFAIFAVQTYNRVSDDQKNITSLKTLTTSQGGQIASLQSQLAADEDQIKAMNTQIATDKGRIDTLNSQLSTANGQINSANEKINTLTTQLSTANTSVGTLKTQLTADEATINSQKDQLASLNQQLAAANTKITNQEAQNTSQGSLITTLQNQMTSANSAITNLQLQISNLNTGTGSGSTTLFSNQSFTVSGQTQTELFSWNAPGSGTLTVSGTTSTANTYIRLNNANGSPTYAFTSGSSVSIPVTVGSNVLYLGSNDVAGTNVTASLTAVVNYSGSNSQTAFGPTFYNFSGQTQTTLASSFYASSTGTLTITGGTTAANAGTIRVYNSSTGITLSYNYYSGISIPISQAGYLTVYFFDNDTAGVAASGTLTGTFYH